MLQENLSDFGLFKEVTCPTSRKILTQYQIKFELCISRLGFLNMLGCLRKRVQRPADKSLSFSPSIWMNKNNNKK